MRVMLLERRGRMVRVELMRNRDIDDIREGVQGEDA